MGYVLIIFLMLIVLILNLILEFFKNFGGILLGVSGICLGIYIIYQIYIALFLASKKFKKIKQSIEKNTNECNDLNEHIEKLKKTNLEFQSFDYGVGILKDNSNYNFKRSQWEKIKKRDNYTCKKCGLSIYKEENLLLEIDHIIPLAKGGITSEKNLQTLCWKCNRSKGIKILK
ncbi:HNH endonuclease signature motif containing protein [Fusobacterium ulcerans]|uniref:HNH endonuclease n=1 Tax=Fusobacterium ulcerans TaxID=861 RepID=UPI0030AA5CCC